MKPIYVVLLFFNCLILTSAQENLDFEEKDDSTVAIPENWRTAGNGFEFHLDSTMPKNGTRCLRMSNVDNGTFGVVTQIIPADSFVGSVLDFTGLNP